MSTYGRSRASRCGQMPAVSSSSGSGGRRLRSQDLQKVRLGERLAAGDGDRMQRRRAAPQALDLGLEGSASSGFGRS
jgi:hypothetical protein